MNELTSQQSRKIKLLPEHLIDQIKAGEVIERPSSLIKELVENSIDANSTKIDIALIDNGLELIAIEDNGNGMSYEDAPYAFLRHATSKIDRFEDLYRLNSFGFRGEALASIAAVSRLTCITKPQKQNGAKLILNEGREELYIPVDGTESGTKIFVKDLFFNTPARLKFIKSKTSEKLALKKIINALLLSHPLIDFSIKWDDSEKEIYRSTTKATSLDETLENAKPRIAQVFFNKKDKVHDLSSFSNDYEDYSVSGFFTKSSSPGNSHKHQYLFVNGRLFFDKSLHQGLMRNLESLWPNGQSGHYAIFLTVPSHEIDVNVHPHKTQVKFFKSDVIYTLLMGGVKKVLHNLKNSLASNLPENAPQSMLDLIDVDQKKELHLQSFQNKHQDFQTYAYEEAIKNAPTQKLSENFDEEIASHSFISEGKWILHHFDGKIYLINRSNLFLYDFFTKFVRITKEKDHSSHPLLISEPLKYLPKNIDIYLETLRSYGFEIELLDQDYYVLRTTSSLIRPTLSSLFVRMFIVLSAQGHNPSIFDSWIGTSDFFQKEIMTFILKEYPLSDVKKIQGDQFLELIQNRCVIHLTDDALESMSLKSYGKK